MARRFVRVDLSEAGRDFRPVAVEPGIAVLDRSGASGKVLFRWLGGLVAEVEWEGDSVGFYVRNDAGGRLEDVVCLPASSDDLKTILQDDFQQLSARLAAARPENAGERALLAVLQANLAALVATASLGDREHPFFRYRDVSNRWRMVWCPGYQRNDSEAAAAVICSNRRCALLYVRRSGQGGKCPACHAAPTPPPPSPTLLARQKRRRRFPLLVLLLAVLLLALWGWNSGLFGPKEHMPLCVGEVAEVPHVDRAPDAPALVVTSTDPAIVQVDDCERLVGVSAGEARVRVRQGDVQRTIGVRVTEPDLESLRIEPARIEVRAGAQASLTVRGRLREGREFDVAPSALRCEKRPAQQYATFDPSGPSLRGVAATPPDASEMLVLALGASQAGAAVRVTGVSGATGVTGATGVLGGRPRPSPVELSILSDQGPPVRFPVGGRFDDFRVEARYPDGFTRLVTRKATLRASGEPGQSAVGIAEGKLVGVRPGKATITARFEGLSTSRGLEAEVAAAANPDEIRVAPAATTLLPGETLRLEAVGFRAGASIGDLSQLPGLTWKSSEAATVRVDGGVAAAVRPGTSAITAQWGALASKPAEIRVATSLDRSAELRADPSLIRLRIGQIARLGGDVRLTQADADVSALCHVTSARPDVVRYVPQRHAIEGMAAGAASVVFSRGDRTTRATIEVVPGPIPEGEVVVEPAADTVSVGQAVELQAYLVTPQGERINRTAAATLESSAPQRVTVSGAWACGMAPGAAEITVRLPEAKQPGRATVVVDHHSLTGVTVEPAQLDMVAGERARLRVLGHSAGGMRELFPQPKLKIVVGGPMPESVRMAGSQHVDAVAPGEARIQVDWDGKFQGGTSVRVASGAWSGLAIEPSRATLHPGHQLGCTVSAVRGGVRRLLSPQDGATLVSSDPNVVRVDPGFGVQAVQPGRATVSASLGDQKADALFEVLSGVGPAGVVVDAPGGAYYVDGPGGVGYLVGRDGVILPDWDSRLFVDPGEVMVLPAVEQLSIQPGQVRMEQGEQTRPFRVVAREGVGASREVAAALASMNAAVVAPDPAAPGRFRAVGAGRTQIRADHGDRSAYAEVTVTGPRFAELTMTVSDQTDKDFAISARIAAPASEGPLEYRVVAPGQTPPDAWTPAVEDGDRRRVTLESPRLVTGPSSTFYNLVFECRDPSGGIQKYPFTFRLTPVVQRAEPK